MFEGLIGRKPEIVDNRYVKINEKDMVGFNSIEHIATHFDPNRIYNGQKLTNFLGISNSLVFGDKLISLDFYKTIIMVSIRNPEDDRDKATMVSFNIIADSERFIANGIVDFLEKHCVGSKIDNEYVRMCFDKEINRQESFSKKASSGLTSRTATITAESIRVIRDRVSKLTINLSESQTQDTYNSIIEDTVKELEASKDVETTLSIFERGKAKLLKLTRGL